jgi:3-methylcrotonyl-CoA carboxylase alpha subunit
MEARLYAEDPTHDFLPSTGRLDHFVLPRGVRNEAGVEEGDRISPYYDPMIAKIVASGATRDHARRRLVEALEEVEVWPVRTNAAFLARAAADADFVAGDVETSFIPERIDRLVPAAQPGRGIWAMAATAALGADYGASEEGAGPWHALSGFRLNAPDHALVALQHAHEIREIDVDDAEAEGVATASGERILIFSKGQAFGFSLPGSIRGGGSASASDGSLQSPMPGRIIAVDAVAGEEVKAGDRLVTLEAMKMEHSLTAPFDGIVTEVHASEGDQVSEGVLLVKMEKVT